MKHRHNTNDADSRIAQIIFAQALRQSWGDAERLQVDEHVLQQLGDTSQWVKPQAGCVDMAGLKPGPSPLADSSAACGRLYGVSIMPWPRAIT